MPQQFRKKPVVVSAMRFDGTRESAVDICAATARAVYLIRREVLGQA